MSSQIIINMITCDNNNDTLYDDKQNDSILIYDICMQQHIICLKSKEK